MRVDMYCSCMKLLKIHRIGPPQESVNIKTSYEWELVNELIFQSKTRILK